MNAPLTADQCAAKDCVNRRDQGAFVGDFCLACDHVFRTAEVGNGTSWVFDIVERYESAVRTLQDIAAMGKKAGSESARHRLIQLGEGTPDYGSMT